VEHSTPQTSGNSFEVEWTAPLAGTGDVKFYAGGNAVNLNTESTGDGAKTAQLTVTEEIPNSVKNELQLSGFAIFPNPVQEVLHFNINSRYSGLFDLQITDVNGKMVQVQKLELHEGQNNSEVNVKNLENGLYLINLNDGKNIAIQTMLKM
jgi:hypothetical protein